MPVELRYTARSDVGLVRKQNQDSAYAGQHLLVLADGMGGPAGGDIASSVAVAHLSALDLDSHAAEDLLPALTEAMHAAHEELITRSRSDHELEGLGTTCIAVLRSGRKMAMIHVGDSRAYVLRDGELTQVTKDHSFVQYLLDNGQITKEQAEHHPQKSVILRVLGDSSEEVIPDESLREAVPGDRWLLCSDGLHGVVSTDTIRDVLTEYKDLDACADKLVELALKGGGPDNVTVIIFDVINDNPDALQTTPQVVGAAATDRLKKSSDSDSPAARAAALSDQAPPAEEEDDTPASSGKLKQWLVRIAVTLILLGGVSGAVLIGHNWIASQYFAIAEGDAIVIYQGIPQEIGPIRLAHELEVKEYAMSDLSPASRNRLSKPVRRSSRAELDAYLLKLINEDRQKREAEESSPEPGSAEPSAEDEKIRKIKNLPRPKGRIGDTPWATREERVPLPTPVNPPQPKYKKSER